VDTLTQGLLGATVGQAGYGRVLGGRAVLWGAVGGLLPDLDMVTAAAGPMSGWLHHRGVTHALWVGPVVGPALGWMMWRWQMWRSARVAKAASSSLPPPLSAWVGLFTFALLTHPLLDLFTSYGTQLLAPFSDRRFALDAVGIIDPVYSALLAAALVVGRIRGPGSRAGGTAAWAALGLSSLYIGYGLQLNRQAEQAAHAQLQDEGLRSPEIHAYPTLLQPYLRRIVVRREDEILVGWLSLWRPRPVEWERYPLPRHSLIQQLRSTPEGATFEWFAMGQTLPTVTMSGAAWVVELHDLRYGFPSRSEPGIWGIRARFGPDGALLDPVERIHSRLPLPAAELLGQLLRFTFD